MEPVLRRALRGPCAVPSGSSLLIAVSGGADSTALLLGLARLAAGFGLTLHAAHLHHGLRGPEADADLEHVRGLCARAGVPLLFARWNTARRMRARGISGQNGLRVLRREFLRAAARRTGARAVATGHTADDQLETLLMRLARGAGLAGLGGMRERHGGWIKPLLEATRDEIEADLVRAGIRWCEDRSNTDPAYLRNRIRHEVVPALVRAMAPGRPAGGARAALARHASEASREAREARIALADWTSLVLPGVYRIQGTEFELDSEGVAPYPIAARRLVLATLWQRLPGALPGLTRRHLESLDRLAMKGRPGSSVALPGGWVACRERGSLRFRRQGIHQDMETR